MSLPPCRRRVTLGPDRHNCTGLRDNSIIVSDHGCRLCIERNGVNPWFLFKQHIEAALSPPIPVYSKTRRRLTIAAMILSLALAVGRYLWRGGKIVPWNAYQARRATCRACEHVKGSRCGLCGCYLPLKALFPAEKCPDEPPRWDAVNVSMPTDLTGKMPSYNGCGCGSSPKSPDLPIISGE